MPPPGTIKHLTCFERPGWPRGATLSRKSAQTDVIRAAGWWLPLRLDLRTTAEVQAGASIRLRARSGRRTVIGSFDRSLNGWAADEARSDWHGQPACRLVRRVMAADSHSLR